MMKTLRRHEGATRAAAGTVARAGRGRAVNEGAATETRFVLVKHTVQIKADYDGLQGAFAQVVRGDDGDGKVIVKVDAESTFNRTNQDREILLCRGEWELVIGDDYIRHGSVGEHAEAGALISRSANLIGWELEGIAPETGERHAAAERRREKLKIRLRELQRRESERKAKVWASLGLRADCKSIVPWVPTVLVQIDNQEVICRTEAGFWEWEHEKRAAWLSARFGKWDAVLACQREGGVA